MTTIAYRSNSTIKRTSLIRTTSIINNVRYAEVYLPLDLISRSTLTDHDYAFDPLLTFRETLRDAFLRACRGDLVTARLYIHPVYWRIA